MEIRRYAMKEKMFYVICAAVLILGFAITGFTEEMSSANFSITTSVMSGGGRTMDSTTNQMTATMGQSSPIGISSSRNYINHPGFWPTIKPTKPEIKRRAMPWIPLLLLDD